jgi:hypothetical protein
MLASNDKEATNCVWSLLFSLNRSPKSGVELSLPGILGCIDLAIGNRGGGK